MVDGLLQQQQERLDFESVANAGLHQQAEAFCFWKPTPDLAECTNTIFNSSHHKPHHGTELPHPLETLKKDNPYFPLVVSRDHSFGFLLSVHSPK
ncbi:hypothetical protein DIPPA_05778 [Diplonema papillatum]|nr:hypothetical protein DIPPA_05778 [Diplonema papillatum]